ncbi:MAG: AbrB/MazE/SpoVT family DNA-binding domain-containing protein [Anaerolineae bacterium]|nr:AbrB/MazE/SpoVT family DNA-binding domain-containing protein [Anaerolineae bacterium]
MSIVTVQLRRKGVITLPIGLRKRYGLNEGDVFALEDLGDGTFLLLPRVSQVARLGDRVAEVMEESGVSTEEVLKALEEEREEYYREHYA